MKKAIKNIFFGAIIGASVLIPGLSGGTSAIILGVYNDILSAVDSFFSDFKKSIRFLFWLAVGGAGGFYICSFPLRYILDRFGFEFSFFVIGVIIGSLPLFFPKEGKVRIHNFAFALAGVAITLLADYTHTLDFGSDGGILSLIAVGIFSAVALILPGISLTYVLIAFGYYDRLVIAVNCLDFSFLLKFGAVVTAGIFLFTHLLMKAYKKYPVSVNMTILGMVLASVKQVFIRMPVSDELLSCASLLGAGLFCSVLFSAFEKRAD